MVRFAGLDSNNEFEAESVKDHIKNLAASAVDVSGLAKREVVDSITQKIESGELKGEPGEAVGVFGEADATLVDGTLTIDPNTAIVNVPRISGVVTVKIGDVVLPEGVESDNGVQVALRIEGVDAGAEIAWPAGTITHDKAVTGRHVALLMRTGDHWEVYFPPAAGSVDDESVFGVNFPPLREMVFDYESGTFKDGRVIPIQEQISGSITENGVTTDFGTKRPGPITSISTIVSRIWNNLEATKKTLSEAGNAVLAEDRGTYREEEAFVYTDPLNQTEYSPKKQIMRPSTIIKEIDGIPHLVYWMPRWSENMTKFLDGSMYSGEFITDVENNPAPSEPAPTRVPNKYDPTKYIWVSPSEEALSKYKSDLHEWSLIRQVMPLSWEAYTVPMTRSGGLDMIPRGSGFSAVDSAPGTGV